MLRLEDLLPNTSVHGILPDGLVTIVNVKWYGSEALELTYKDANGKVANELLYRHDELRLKIVAIRGENGRNYRHTGKGAYIGTRPSKASVQGICRKISGLAVRRSVGRPTEAVVGDLNRLITGWTNYFCLGQTTPAYRTANYHAETRLRRWLCHKHKVKSGGLCASQTRGYMVTWVSIT